MCGVMGLKDLADRDDMIPDGIRILSELQKRGEEAAGISWKSLNGLQVLKDAGRVNEVLTTQRLHTARAMSSAMIGHVRYSTNKFRDARKAHPYLYEDLAFAFNGNYPDYDEQAARLTERGHAPEMEGDTEVIGRTLIDALRRNGRGKINEALVELDQLDGASFNIVMLQPNGDMTAVRDPQGRHPLVYAQEGSQVAIASEDSAIRALWRRANIKMVQPGHMLHVSSKLRKPQHIPLWMAREAHCAFEWIYFANHRSVLEGTSVRDARYECGQILAEMDSDRPPTDIVVQVPHSAKPIADGYVDARNLRRIDGILARNERTFTTSSDRLAKAMQKYDIDPDCMRGKNIILIDDSLVRGTTMRALAQRLRDEGGVNEIHLRLAFPPIVSPCFEGIDFPTVDELLVRKYCDGTLTEEGVLPQSVLDAMAPDLGVTSIKFLSVKGLPRAIGKKRENLCIGCATKDYPTRKERELAVLAEQKACAGKCGGCGS